MAFLEVNRCTVAFGGLVALDDVTMHVDEGQIVGLIGPNGAGKTTVFNLITGVCRPAKSRSRTAEVETTSDSRLPMQLTSKRIKVYYGDIIFDNRSIRNLQPHLVSIRGIGRTFQNIRLFPDLSVLDNVRAACHAYTTVTLVDSLLRTNAHYTEEQEIENLALHLLDVMELGKYKEQYAGSLPYGEQRRLEVARALAARPKLLLLDEPAAGMNPQETSEMMRLIKWIRDEFNETIFLIEHDMKLVMGVCERVYVLDYGEIIAHGTPEEVRVDPRVIEAYLGEE